MPKNKPYEGLHLLNKPRGISSSKFLIEYLKENDIPRDTKAGYAGTLDVLAEGLLIVGIGRKWTKQLAELSDADKIYETTVNLSGWTESGDLEFPVQRQGISKQEPPYDWVLQVLEDMIGPQDQLPPMYSAKIVNGERAYMAAREGRTLDLKPCKIIVHSIELLDYDFPKMELQVKCSKGTFIRALAEDIGKCLTGGAYVERLRRTCVGDYSL
jgi:tRNA pseudouridine55 synthase